MPPLTMQEEGLTKGTSCPSHVPRSVASETAPAGASEGSVAATRSSSPGREAALSATPSWTVYRLACHRLRWSLMQPGRARTSGLWVPPLPLAQWVGWVAPVRSTHGVLVLTCPSAALRVHLCAVSCATLLLFADVPARCVVLRVPRPGSPCFCSPVCPLGALLCSCGVLGHLAPVHRCARVVCCVACAVSWAPWLLFTGAPARCVAFLLRCTRPLGSCSLMCLLGMLCCVCGVLGHLAPVHQYARSVCCVVLRVQCPWPLGSFSPVCVLRPLLCLCGVLGHLASVLRCARSVCCGACAVSWAT